MPVDPKIIGLAMTAVDKVMDSSYGEKALDALLKKPEVETTKRKKRATAEKRSSGPRRRSERQAQRYGGVQDERKVIKREPPRVQSNQQNDLKGSGNMSGLTYSTCETTFKTKKYQPAPG